MVTIALALFVFFQYRIADRQIQQAVDRAVDQMEVRMRNNLDEMEQKTQIKLNNMSKLTNEKIDGAMTDAKNIIMREARQTSKKSTSKHKLEMQYYRHRDSELMTLVHGVDYLWVSAQTFEFGDEPEMLTIANDLLTLDLKNIPIAESFIIKLEEIVKTLNEKRITLSRGIDMATHLLEIQLEAVELINKIDAILKLLKGADKK